MRARLASRSDESVTLSGSPVPRDPRIRVPPDLTHAIAYQLRLAQEASFAAYRERVGNADFKPGRYSWLMLVRDNPGATPTALSRALGRDKSTVTAALRDLETRGLVRRRERAGDRRSYGVELTEAGRTLLVRLRREAEAHDALLDRVVGADKACLVALLERVTVALTGGDACEPA